MAKVSAINWFEIPVNDLPSGMYLVNIKMEGYEVNRKLVVVR